MCIAGLNRTFRSGLSRANSSGPRMSCFAKSSLYSVRPRLSSQFPTSSTPQNLIIRPGNKTNVIKTSLQTSNTLSVTFLVTMPNKWFLHDRGRSWKIAYYASASLDLASYAPCPRVLYNAPYPYLKHRLDHPTH